MSENVDAFLARLKRRGLRLVVWLRRHPWLIATFGFVSGVLSFFLVERHEGVARAMAVAMLAGWLLLVLERVLDRAVKRRFGFGLPPALVRYLTQFTHQESLFFALPFFFASTSWNSGQAVFTSALGLMALVAILDPVYFGRLATRRWLFLGYHTLALFALLLVVFPLVLQVPALASYQLALGVAVALSFPTLAGAISVPRWWRGLLVLALLVALGAAGWLALPPGLHVLQHPAVLIVSGFMLLVEFFADKVPWLDSAWDVLHTVIRVPAGALLAAGVFGADNATMAVAAGLLGGSLSATALATKMTTRAAVNTSPEPFSNWGLSFLEDGLVVAVVWLATQHPLWFGVALVLMLIVSALLLVLLFSFLRAVIGRVSRFFSGSPGVA